MGWLNKLFGGSSAAGSAGGSSGGLKLWAADRATADNLANDQAFLFGALMADGSPQAKAFLDSMSGKTIQSRIEPSPKGGFDVTLNLI